MAGRDNFHGLLPLEPSGPGPLYRQVKRELQRVVEAGRFAPGDTLPSEAAMLERFLRAAECG